MDHPSLTNVGQPDPPTEELINRDGKMMHQVRPFDVHRLWKWEMESGIDPAVSAGWGQS
jgi:hypothetical protein